MISSTLLAILVPTTTAQLFSFAYPSTHQLSFFDHVNFDTEPPCGSFGNSCLPATRTSTGWLATNEAYSYKMRLPDLEPDSVTAEMSADSSSIKVIGKRTFEGCTCEPRQATEISLPYRPRAEDVSVSYDSGLLTLKLDRQSKAEAAVPLKVMVNKEKDVATSSEMPKGASEDGAAPDGTRPLRFVPHESAKASSTDKTDNKDGIEAQEKGLMEKFRTAGKVAGAMAMPMPGSTATEEPTADGADSIANDNHT